ncbi:hypothetical protein OROMI_032987 [Orobanche minor]
MEAGKQIVTDNKFFEMVERYFGDWIDKDGLVLDEEALTAARPTRFPSLPEDPAERKKVFTQYIKHIHGSTVSCYAQAVTRAREKARISSTLEAATHKIPTMMASGSDELKNDCN